MRDSLIVGGHIHSLNVFIACFVEAVRLFQQRIEQCMHRRVAIMFCEVGENVLVAVREENFLQSRAHQSLFNATDLYKSDRARGTFKQLALRI